MTAILPFLLANWRWLVPAILLAGLAIDDGIHRIEAADCKAARAADNLGRAYADCRERHADLAKWVRGAAK